MIMKLFDKEKQGNLRKITVLGKTFTYHKKPRIPRHIDQNRIDKKMMTFDDFSKKVTLQTPVL